MEFKLSILVLALSMFSEAGAAMNGATREIVDLKAPNSNFRLIVGKKKEVPEKNLVYLYSVQVVDEGEERFLLKDSYEERKFICNSFGHGDPDPIANPFLNMNQLGTDVVILNETEKLERARKTRRYNAIDMVPCKLKGTATSMTEMFE